MFIKKNICWKKSIFDFITGNVINDLNNFILITLLCVVIFKFSTVINYLFSGNYTSVHHLCFSIKIRWRSLKMATVVRNVRALFKFHPTVLRRSICRFSAVSYVHNRHQTNELCCLNSHKLLSKVDIWVFGLHFFEGHKHDL